MFDVIVELTTGTQKLEVELNIGFPDSTQVLRGWIFHSVGLLVAFGMSIKDTSCEPSRCAGVENVLSVVFGDVRLALVVGEFVFGHAAFSVDVDGVMAADVVEDVVFDLGW